VALRPSGDGLWRLVSAGRRVAREDPRPAGDLGDRAFAAALALGAVGVDLPPLEIAVVADLPEAAGLASSAALCCAVAVAGLRLAGARLGAEALAEVALTAERDIVGVPCGPLDQRAVVGRPEAGATLLDCADGSVEAVPWGVRGCALVACDTGQAHDVGGGGYRQRRAEAEGVLRAMGARTVRELTPERLGAAALRPPLDRRARHLVTESGRAVAAAAALRAGDPVTVGALMTASHASLRDDCAVSTPALDAAVGAALSVAGCHGARMVGAGFGGTAVALVEAAAADACGRAMSAAVPGGRGTWRLGHGPGLAVTAADVLAG
jgi:galactokinase